MRHYFYTQFTNSFFKALCFLVLFSLSLPVAHATSPSADSTITVAAGKHYLKNAFHRFWWGSHYRKVWAEPVEVPYFWPGTFKGGVEPTKQGGSFQTKNLRLVDANRREYVLRSIDKDPSKALPKSLQKTFVANLMRDQTSVIHPYGAFIVPALATAAGVYHTNPKLIYIADDPALGDFRQEFANTLALLEERPDGNWETIKSFGNPKEIVSSKKAFDSLVKNPDHQVETKRYLQSRLFDMWLSDWSRREDQWRWTVKQKGEITQYAPIPRDRDHAFFKFNDGVLTKLATVFKPNYQSFDKTIVGKNVKGLIKSSYQMDAYLLAYLTKDDFHNAALDLQNRLSDAVIDQALQTWPKQIRDLSADEFAKKLKSRREDLPVAAHSFFKQLNNDVLLPGTDEKDTFEFRFQEDGSLEVHHWSEKDGKQFLLHQKTYSPKETKSISVFGLSGKDKFVLKGKGVNKIQLTFYGGENTDKLVVNSSLKLSGKKIMILDEEDGNDYPKHPQVKVKPHTPTAQEFNGEGWLLRHRLH